MYAGVDLGASNLRTVVADADGTRGGVERRGTPQGPTADAVTEAVLDAIRSACDDAGVPPTSLRAVGIGSIGPLDQTAGAVARSVNLPDELGRISLTEPVAALVDSDAVYLHNDAVAGVLGERLHGGAPADVAYLTISSGIGVGACVDGRVLSGRGGNAGELGHVTVDPDGALRCGCGGRGHWEAYCSGSGVPRFAEHLHEVDPVETAVPVGGDEFSAADVFAHAGDDRFADHVVERVARYNALGVATIVHAYAPQLVTVGGAVALENPDLVLDPIRDRLPDLVVADAPPLRATELGEDVVVRGALASAMTGGTGDPANLPR